jgi:gamma-glutamylcyclotransferase (GGCT)/AIG2-like uncharacterized protein YtfP
MSKIFVYGSLRMGGPLHGALADSEYVETCRTKPEYSLRSLGAFPALCPGGKTAVLGEVYEVSDDTKKYLDRVEGHPHLYVRTSIEVGDGVEVEAYIFHHDTSNNDLVESGDWIEYAGTASSLI